MTWSTRTAFAFDRSGGFAMAHGSAFATSFARFRGPSALAPDASGCLGGLGLHGERPAIAEALGRIAVAYVEDGKPRLFVDKAGLLELDRPARAVALSFERRSVLLVAADEDGLWAIRVAATSPLEVTELGRLVRRGDVRGALEVHPLGDGHLVLYGLRDAALGVVRVGADGAVRDVRYGLDAPVVHLASSWGTRRAAVALSYDDDRVERALFDASGRAIERPHVALRLPGARFVSAQAVWTGRRFAAGALDATDGVCSLALEEGEPPTRLSGFRPGPLALFHRRDRWVGLQVETDGSRVGVAIRTLGGDGSGGEGGVRWFEPRGRGERELRGRAARLLRELRRELQRATYRDEGELVVDEGALALSLGRDRGALALPLSALRSDGLARELELPERGGASRASIADRIGRLFGRAPDRAMWEAVARELAEGILAVSEVRMRSTGARRVLRLGLTAWPTGAALAELSARARRVALAPRDPSNERRDVPPPCVS
jgi:hypothetical protein